MVRFVFWFSGIVWSTPLLPLLPAPLKAEVVVFVRVPVDSFNNYSYSIWNCSQRLGKKIERIGNQRKNRNHTDQSIVKISLNIRDTWGGLLSLWLQWKTTSQCGYENSQISARRPNLVLINKKKRNYRLADFTVLADQTTEWKWKWKKAKSWTNIRTLPESWKGCGTWRWHWYQSNLGPLEFPTQNPERDSIN